MGFNLYGIDDDENLLLLAEFEADSEDEVINPAMVLDTFLDEAGDDVEQYDNYVGLNLDDGTFVVMNVTDHEPVNTRRAIEVMTADDDEEEDEPAPKKRRGRPPGTKNKPKVEVVEEDDEDEDEETPVPKRRGRPPGTKNKPGAKKPGPKAKSNKKKSGGIKKNPASEE